MPLLIIFYSGCHILRASKQSFYSVTDVVAMDCEMVGVGQGNKSALGRVTLVFVNSFHYPHCDMLFIGNLFDPCSGRKQLTKML